MLLRQRQTFVSAATAALPALASTAVGLPQLDQKQVRWIRSGRSRRGLYDGKDVRTGNNVSFSMRHTRRTFKPNVFKKRVYSEILDEMVRFHLTTSTLRSIDKDGGLDNYLLNPRRKITEGEGYHVKKRILKKMKNQARFDRKKAEREGQQQESGYVSV